MPVITTLTKRDSIHWLCETMMIIAEELGYPEDAQAIREKTPWRRSQPMDRAPAGLPQIVKNLREKLKGRAYPAGDATAAKAVIADVLGGSLDPLLWLRCVAPWHNHFVLQMIAARLWPLVVPAAGDVICQGLLVASVEGKHENANCTVRDSILIQSERSLCYRAIVDNSMLVVFGGDPVGPYVPWNTADYDPADSPTRALAHAPGAAIGLLAAIQPFPGEDDQAVTDLDRTVSSPVLGPEKAPIRFQPFAPLQAVLEQIEADLPSISAWMWRGIRPRIWASTQSSTTTAGMRISWSRSFSSLIHDDADSSWSMLSSRHQSGVKIYRTGTSVQPCTKANGSETTTTRPGTASIRMSSRPRSTRPTYSTYVTDSSTGSALLENLQPGRRRPYDRD